jgi:hypothetical protein
VRALIDEPLGPPAAAEGPIRVGDSRVNARVRATDVLTENGAVRVRGTWALAR